MGLKFHPANEQRVKNYWLLKRYKFSYKTCAAYRDYPRKYIINLILRFAFIKF